MVVVDMAEAVVAEGEAEASMVEVDTLVAIVVEFLEGYRGASVGGNRGGYRVAPYRGYYGFYGGGYYGPRGYYPYWGIFGFPMFGWPYLDWPYASYYGGWPYYPAITADATLTPEYTEPEQQQQSQYRYYCTDPQGFYPYIRNCPGGWLTVVPNATPPSPPPGFTPPPSGYLPPATGEPGTDNFSPPPTTSQIMPNFN